MIILSCGHEVDDMEHTYSAITKATDRSGEKAIHYSVVCGPCEDQYRQHGCLFDKEELAMQWLFKEEW